MRKKYDLPYPFEPPWEDLKMVTGKEGARCYIFDTFCKDITPEEKMETDTEIVRICRRMERLAAAGNTPQTGK